MLNQKEVTAVNNLLKRGKFAEATNVLQERVIAEIDAEGTARRHEVAADWGMTVEALHNRLRRPCTSSAKISTLQRYAEFLDLQISITSPPTQRRKKK